MNRRQTMNEYKKVEVEIEKGKMMSTRELVAYFEQILKEVE